MSLKMHIQILGITKTLLHVLLKNIFMNHFLWIPFGCLNAAEPLRRDSLLLTTKSPGVTGTHLIDLERMKGRLYLGATPMVFNPEPLDLESSVLIFYEFFIFYKLKNMVATHKIKHNTVFPTPLGHL